MASRCHHALKKPVFDTLHTVHIHDIHTHDTYTHTIRTHTRARVRALYFVMRVSDFAILFSWCVRETQIFHLSLSFSLCSSSHLVIVTHAVNISFSSFLVFLRFYPSICFSLLLYNSFSQVVFPDEPREQIWSTSENLKKKHSKKHSSLARHRK